MQPLTEAVLKVQHNVGANLAHILGLAFGYFAGSAVFYSGAQEKNFTLMGLGVLCSAVGVWALISLIKASGRRSRASAAAQEVLEMFLAERGVVASTEARQGLKLPVELPRTSTVLGTAEVLHRDRLTKVVLKYDASGPAEGAFVLLSANGEPLRELIPAHAA